MNPKSHARAVRYRQLALAEPDKAKAAVLFKIAEEADRDVLCTSLGFTRRPEAKKPEAQKVPVYQSPLGPRSA
jgi:hypothetical protein